MSAKSQEKSKPLPPTGVWKSGRTAAERKATPAKQAPGTKRASGSKVRRRLPTGSGSIAESAAAAIAKAAAAGPDAVKSREQRISMRVLDDQKRLFQRAAGLKGQTLSDFILTSSEKAAEEVLGSQTRFVVSEEQQQKFVEALDAPPRANEKLLKLFISKSVFEQ